MATYKANQAILLRVVVTLVFHVRQTKQFCELCQVNMAPLQNLLPFRFIPSNPHSLIVEKFSLFTTREKMVMGSGLGRAPRWNHLQQAMALAAYYNRMKHREGWAPARLLPLLAGLNQLVPWLLQWHNDVDPDLQLRLGEFYRDFVRDEAQSLGYTMEQLRAWQPLQATRSRRR